MSEQTTTEQIQTNLDAAHNLLQQLADELADARMYKDALLLCEKQGWVLKRDSTGWWIVDALWRGRIERREVSYPTILAAIQTAAGTVKPEPPKDEWPKWVVRCTAQTDAQRIWDMRVLYGPGLEAGHYESNGEIANTTLFHKSEFYLEDQNWAELTHAEKDRIIAAAKATAKPDVDANNCRERWYVNHSRTLGEDCRYVHDAQDGQHTYHLSGEPNPSADDYTPWNLHDAEYWSSLDGEPEAVKVWRENPADPALRPYREHYEQLRAATI